MNLRNFTRRGGYSANSIYRPGKERRDDYIELVSDKIIGLFMASTEKVLEGIVLLCPGMVKDDVRKNERVQRYFQVRKQHTFTTGDVSLPTVLAMFKEYYASVVSTKKEPIIFIVQGMTCRADTEARLQSGACSGGLQ